MLETLPAPRAKSWHAGNVVGSSVWPGHYFGLTLYSCAKWNPAMHDIRALPELYKMYMRHFAGGKHFAEFHLAQLYRWNWPPGITCSSIDLRCTWSQGVNFICQHCRCATIARSWVDRRDRRSITTVRGDRSGRGDLSLVLRPSLIQAKKSLKSAKNPSKLFVKRIALLAVVLFQNGGPEVQFSCLFVFFLSLWIQQFGMPVSGSSAKKTVSVPETLGKKRAAVRGRLAARKTNLPTIRKVRSVYMEFFVPARKRPCLHRGFRAGTSWWLYEIVRDCTKRRQEVFMPVWSFSNEKWTIRLVWTAFFGWKLLGGEQGRLQ